MEQINIYLPSLGFVFKNLVYHQKFKGMIGHQNIKTNLLKKFILRVYDIHVKP